MPLPQPRHLARTEQAAATPSSASSVREALASSSRSPNTLRPRRRGSVGGRCCHRAVGRRPPVRSLLGETTTRRCGSSPSDSLRRRRSRRSRRARPCARRGSSGRAGPARRARVTRAAVSRGERRSSSRRAAVAADVEHQPAARPGLLLHGQPGQLLQRVEGLAALPDQRAAGRRRRSRPGRGRSRRRGRCRRRSRRCRAAARGSRRRCRPRARAARRPAPRVVCIGRSRPSRRPRRVGRGCVRGGLRIGRSRVIGLGRAVGSGVRRRCRSRRGDPLEWSCGSVRSRGRGCRVSAASSPGWAFGRWPLAVGRFGRWPGRGHSNVRGGRAGRGVVASPAVIGAAARRPPAPAAGLRRRTVAARAAVQGLADLAGRTASPSVSGVEPDDVGLLAERPQVAGEPVQQHTEREVEQQSGGQHADRDAGRASAAGSSRRCPLARSCVAPHQQLGRRTWPRS